MGVSELLLVELRANTSEFNKKFKEAEHQVESFGTKSSGGLQKFAALGGASLAVAGAAAVAVGVESLHAADDFEKSHARLENAVSRAGLSFEKEKGTVDAANRAMEAFGFTNAESENSLSRLVTSTGSVTKAQRDQAIAADVARARGIDLQAATDLLVKVEGGRYTALGKLGIATKDQIKGFKDSGEAVQFLADKYKGAASRDSETFAGKMNVLKATVTDLAVQIGLKLIPIIESLASGLSDVIHWFDDNRAAAYALGGVISAVLVPAMVTFIALKVASFAEAVATGFKLMTGASLAAAAGMEALAVAEGEEAVAADAVAVSNAAMWASILGPIALVAVVVGGILEIANALGYFDETLTKSEKAAPKWADSVVQSSQQAGHSLKDAKAQYDELGKAIKRQGDNQLEVEHAVAGGAQRWQQYGKTLVEAIAKGHEFGSAVAELKAKHDALGASIKHAEEVTKQKAAADQKAADAAGFATVDQYKLAKAYDDEAKAADAAAKKTQSYADDAFKAADAGFALTDATKTFTDDLAKSGAGSEQVAKDIIAVTRAAGAKAALDLGPGATASQQTLQNNAAQLISLTAMKDKYPQLKGTIDGYLISLQHDIDLSTQSQSTNEKSIAVLDGLKLQYPQLKGQIDALEGSIRAQADSQNNANASGQTAGAVLDGLKAQYPQLRGQIDALKDSINNLPDKNVTVTADISQAQANLNAFRLQLIGIMDAASQNSYGGHLTAPGGSGRTFFGKPYALGGPIPGPSSQAVPILAHGGEYVLSADVVDRIKSGRASQGATVGGGTVGGTGSSGGGGGDVYITVNSTALTARDVAHAVVQGLQDHVRTNGQGQLKKLVGVN